MRNFIMIAFALLMSGCSHHHRVQAPAGCLARGYHYHADLLVLHTAASQQSQLFLLYNVSNHKILINHYLWGDPGASAGWSSVIASNRWSAIVLNRTKFPISCKVMGHEYKKVDCAKVLFACQFPNISINAKRLSHSSFWAVESVFLHQLLQRLQQRFIQIRSSSS